MYSKIQNKMRSELRQRQIHQIFELKRLKHLNSTPKPIFATLQVAIQENADQPLSIQIINRLIQLMQACQDDENTYILIGNYLLDHHETENYLRLHLLNISQVGRKIKNFKWVIAIALASLSNPSPSVLDNYEELISILISQAISNEQLQDASRLLKMLMITINNKDEQFYPQNSIEMLFKKINKINLHSLEENFKNELIDIVDKVIRRHCDKPCCRDYLYSIIKVIQLVMQSFPIHRQNYLSLMKSLFLQYPFHFEESLFSQVGLNIIDQLNYLFKDVQVYREQILALYEIFIGQFSFSNIVTLLNHKIYQILIIGMDIPDNQCILKSLLTIRILLMKIAEEDEMNLLDQVISVLNLQTYLVNLNEKELNNSIDGIVYELLQNYIQSDS